MRAGDEIKTVQVYTCDILVCKKWRHFVKWRIKHRPTDQTPVHEMTGGMHEMAPFRGTKWRIRHRRRKMAGNPPGSAAGAGRGCGARAKDGQSPVVMRANDAC
jgi:hypothetical protein